MSDVPLAYPVPWLFLRDRAPFYGLKNASLETLRDVRFTLDGPGAMALRPPFDLAPGSTAWLGIHGDDLARASRLVVRWARQTGDEYLWRFAL